MSAELKKEIENIDFDLSELSTLELIAKRPDVKTLLATEVTRLKQKKNPLLIQLKALSAEANASPQTTSVTSGTGTVGQSAMGTVIVNNYMWDQTNDFVKIYIEIDRNCSLDSTQMQMTFKNNRSFEIIFGKNKFRISKLFADIDANQSYHKVSKSGKQLIIYLKKVSQKQWTSINEVENKLKKALDEEREDKEDKEDKEGSKDDPSAGLMKLMKQMYDEGDDEMKRTIAKSWYESRQKNAGDLDMKMDNLDL